MALNEPCSHMHHQRKDEAEVGDTIAEPYAFTHHPLIPCSSSLHERSISLTCPCYFIIGTLCLAIGSFAQSTKINQGISTKIVFFRIIRFTHRQGVPYSCIQ
ncbi:hypothetical protein AG1IA_05972 [Rhizoctonia solani AG-1 IA]|uniref:Uncharacterized protein n=1 Tax=Thanatephorus cucumeris (strain AG1-IA) TaxID=983506 RepID=L8WUG1_THACA|nr:hypothetical protein AG1IA_05972 [Rhizoctonia solani AG-1 IA]